VRASAPVIVTTTGASKGLLLSQSGGCSLGGIGSVGGIRSVSATARVFLVCIGAAEHV